MKLSKRQKAGAWLIVLAAIAMIGYGITAGKSDVFHGQPRLVGGEGTASKEWEFVNVEVYSIDGSAANLLGLISIFACGAAGFLMLVWPARKPPKLSS